MSNRSTHEITTTNGHKVVLYDWLSAGGWEDLEAHFDDVHREYDTYNRALSEIGETKDLTEKQYEKLLTKTMAKYLPLSAIRDAERISIKHLVVSVDGDSNNVVESVLSMRKEDKADVVNAVNAVTDKDEKKSKTSKKGRKGTSQQKEDE